MTLWLTLPTAFILGLLHALDADHVIAVTTFIARRPRPRQAVRFCLQWGLGHMLPLLALGVGAILLGRRIPAAFAWAAELAVGGVLLVLGGLVFRDLWRRRVHLHVHEHDGVRHAHLHSHAGGAHHAHTHAPTLVGVLHGLAGTAGVFVVVPVAALASAWAAALYIAVFSAAVILMMVLYGASAGFILGRVQERSVGLYRWALALVGTLSVGAGALWIGRLL
jgi:sulfite exporter TauE/SafE